MTFRGSGVPQLVQHWPKEAVLKLYLYTYISLTTQNQTTKQEMEDILRTLIVRNEAEAVATYWRTLNQEASLIDYINKQPPIIGRPRLLAIQERMEADQIALFSRRTEIMARYVRVRNIARDIARRNN